MSGGRGDPEGDLGGATMGGGIYRFGGVGLSLAAGLILATVARGDGPAAAATPLPGVPWPATDGLGLSLPPAGAVPAPRPGRFVGMFYFLWHDGSSPRRPDGAGPLDVSRILLADPNAARNGTSPPWGPVGAYHYWGEPLLGYYRSDDRWVIRRHARLLADAGVDVLIFDATNAQTYPQAYTAIGEVFADVRRLGGRTPGIAFMVNTNAAATARRLLDDLYKPGLFRDLWFAWDGRPLLLCDPADADAEARAFFTLRRAHWPFTMEDTRDAWHWEATYPQPLGLTGDPPRPEQVSVSVAQNLRVADGKVTHMSAGDARGRNFHAGARDAAPGAVDRGGNFAEQWRRAIEVDPPFVLVTGWNEWIAGRWGDPGQPPIFVDQFDREFSRDIEPMRGGHGDAYYYQLVAHVRRYKGVGPIPSASAPKSIPLAAGRDAWADVLPVFGDDSGDAIPRDHLGAGGTHYVDRSARNDIVACRVARDATTLNFLVQAREPLTPPADPNWMTLLIDADRDPRTGWHGYDFRASRRPDDPPDQYRLERAGAGGTWEEVATIPAHVASGRLQLAIPRAALGLADAGPVAIDFKWADNLQHPDDIMDFYQSGDVAPEGRFNFRYQAD